MFKAEETETTTREDFPMATKIATLARAIHDVTDTLPHGCNTGAFAEAMAALGVKLVAKMSQEEGV